MAPVPEIPKDLIQKLKETLTRQGIDYERLVADLGQVARVERRMQGETAVL